MPIASFATLLLAAAAPAANPCAEKPEDCIIIADLKDPSYITVAASRTPVALTGTGISISQIRQPQIEGLSLPLVKDYLTLVPGVAVAQTGPMGAQTQVRIRGAEANHSISFIDGIEMNDPASSGEFRLDTLLSHGVDRIEVLRGPQSALWGSQAIGGVINIVTRAPLAGTLFHGELQGGSLGTVRGGIGGGWAGENLTISGQLSGLSSDGYDIARSGGDRDGYDNVTAHGRIEWRAAPELTLLMVGRHQDSTSRFDGFNFVTGVPRDEPLATRSRQTALRAEAALTLLDGTWTTRASFMAVRADNINRRAGSFQNRSDGERDLFRLQSTGLFDAAGASHSLTAALDVETERFSSRDANAQAASNQRQRRRQTSLVGEYRLTLDSGVSAGAAVRHDRNDRFADATTVRFDAVAPIGDFRLHAAFGTGIADPTFFDQFGFFPGSFRGNPNLVPERSRSFEAGIGWASGSTSLDVTLFDANLTNEIIGTFDNITFIAGVANATGRSTRRGVEVAGRAELAKGLGLTANYTYLDANQQQTAGTAMVREVRRPRHSGSIALNYSSRDFDLSAAAAITGARGDTDFARFVPVTLPAYTIVTLAGAWHLTPRIDLTARIENALDATQVDVFAYRGPGITVHGGIRFRL
ncbi:TonB-dependent receptor [Sandarakinorhabdus sp. AAP62]|uniref:TonB-dependent receptor plug domain-containing protein n=1 Tax=Sandarakinorhabdus sp. AAP62 TaxID=1248916 RepID=UPI0002D3F074|nr:TonB-dependent receptor [Sandarakinorhabdus sp. AAP62]